MSITNIERIPKSITVRDLHKAILHAQSSHPNECCGVFTHSSGYIACTNIASNPTSSFVIAEQKQMVSNYDDIIAVWHSHPDTCRQPSRDDMLTQIATNLCWGVVVVDNNRLVSDVFFWGSFDNIPNYVGRVYRSGSLDSYALIRDIYYSKLKIELCDFPRELGDANPLIDNYVEAGFTDALVSTCEPADVIVYKTENGVWDCGVLIDKKTVLIHEANCFSRVCFLSELDGRIRLVLKHKNIKSGIEPLKLLQ